MEIKQATNLDAILTQFVALEKAKLPEKVIVR